MANAKRKAAFIAAQTVIDAPHGVIIKSTLAEQTIIGRKMTAAIKKNAKRDAT